MGIDARHAWLVYLAITFVVTPIVFALRYGRSPFVIALPPTDRYAWIEALYGATLVGYTAWLVADAPARPVSPVVGAIVSIGGTLVVTAGVVALGPNWRIGQDARDDTVAYVRSGLYGLIAHPIYVGLLMVGVGVALLDDSVARAALLLGSTGLYTLVQSGDETSRWRRETV